MANLTPEARALHDRVLAWVREAAVLSTTHRDDFFFLETLLEQDAIEGMKVTQYAYDEMLALGWRDNQ